MAEYKEWHLETDRRRNELGLYLGKRSGELVRSRRISGFGAKRERK